MHINSQLMEAVQQKVELSQQLDQWQVRYQFIFFHNLEEIKQANNSKTTIYVTQKQKVGKQS